MKGLIIFADKMEDNESLSTLALLRRAGYVIDSAAFKDDFEVTTSYGIDVVADRLLADLNLANYDYLIIPGGPWAKTQVQSTTIVDQVIQEFAASGKMIAAICAAPGFLGKAGLLDGKQFTCFPDTQQWAPQGHYRPELKAVTDQNIITARSAGAVMEFVCEIITYLDGENKAQELLKALLY